MHDEYYRRLEWYSDSRLGVMMSPLGKQAVLRQKQLRAKVREMEEALKTVEGTARHLETARKRLWDMEGQLLILESLRGIASLDSLMKKRLEQKLTAKAAQV